MKLSKLSLFAALLFVFALVLAPAAEARGAKAPGGNTIYEIASSSPDFTTLTFALEATGLDAALNGSGQFTVFAPNDAAFAALEAANPGITAFLIDNPDTLASVLLYHVTDGRRWSNSLVNRNNPKPVQMLSGGFITVNPNAAITDTNSFGLVSPDSEILAANISASNGVIHVISEVLIP